MQDLLDDLRRRAIGGILRRCFAVLEACQAVLPKSRPPAIEAGSADAKIPTRLADITNLVSVLEHPQLVVHIAPEFVHPDFPSGFQLSCLNHRLLIALLEKSKPGLLFLQSFSYSHPPIKYVK